MKRWTMAWVGAAALASTPALAAEQHPERARAHRGELPEATIEALESRDDALQRRAMAQRVGPAERREIDEQRQQIDELIDDLEAGKPIDRYELDEVLGQPYHHHGHGMGPRHDRGHEGY